METGGCKNQSQTQAHRPLAGDGERTVETFGWVGGFEGERTVTFGRRSGDGAGRTGGGIVGGRRWRSVGLREEMERGRETIWGENGLGRLGKKMGWQLAHRLSGFSIFFFNKKNVGVA